MKNNPHNLVVGQKVFIISFKKWYSPEIAETFINKIGNKFFTLEKEY